MVMKQVTAIKFNMKKVKQLLQKLPSPYREQALENFDEEFFEDHKSQGAPITTSGKALAVSFDWDRSKRGYHYWEKVAISN